MTPGARRPPMHRAAVEILVSGADVNLRDATGRSRPTSVLDPVDFVERCALENPDLVACFAELFTEMKDQLETAGAL